MSRLVDVGFAAGWRVVRWLPQPVASAAFRAAADTATRRGGSGIRRLAQNLRRVVGPDLPDAELDLLVRDAIRSYARYYLEAFRLPSLTAEQRLNGFHLDREDDLAAAVAAGRGVVVALPHAGNWDAAGAWVAAKGWKLATVAERLKPESVYERFLAYRRSLGMEILPLTGGDRPLMDVLTDRLNAGYVVPLLADRDLSARGVPVRFFEGRTRMPAGPALLALRTGAPLFTVSLWYERDVVCGALRGPIEVPPSEYGPLNERVREVTQRVADNLAAGIAQHPQDWHMLQRIWLDDPSPETTTAQATTAQATTAQATTAQATTAQAASAEATEPPAAGRR